MKLDWKTGRIPERLGTRTHNQNLIPDRPGQEALLGPFLGSLYTGPATTDLPWLSVNSASAAANYL